MSINPRDLHDQILYPHECFTALRESGPLVYNANGKFWEVFEYEDVHYVVSEHELFSSDGSKFTAHLEEELMPGLLNSDPPRHQQLRSLVSQAFTPRKIAQLAPRIAEITNDLLDQVVAKGSMDIIDDLSYPLPVIVIAELLGVPIEDRDKFKRWSDDLVYGEYEELAGVEPEVFAQKVRERVKKTLDEIYDYFRVIIAQRRNNPEHDLVTELLAAQIDGEYLSELEVLNFCALLLVAGNITTTNLIGNAILCFDEHSKTMELLRQHPDLIPSAIEEVLRYRSPVTMIGRIAARDMTLKDQEIQKGQFVIGCLASANHDPAQFLHPERFDIERNPNRHVSFGHGIHFCLGAPLARLESKIALAIMLERLQNIRRDRDQEILPVQSAFIYGVKHLPVTFTAS